MIWIPGDAIALITLPGVVFHEIAHRFFCDLFNVPVYEINYFTPFASTVGHVRHKPTTTFVQEFFIGTAPFFVNSILCVLLTLPKALPYFFGTSFLVSTSPVYEIIVFFLFWVGFSAGFTAIPSNQDLNYLGDKTDSRGAKLFAKIIYGFFFPFNMHILGVLLSFTYAYILSQLLPFILFGAEGMLTWQTMPGLVFKFFCKLINLREFF